MAIIKCKTCGGDVSDKAEKCPHCGAILTNELANRSGVVICEECGKEIPSESVTCPNCGCPIPAKKSYPYTTAVANTTNVVTKKGSSTNTKKIIACILAVILIGGIIFISQNTLTGHDKEAYEMVLLASKYFKNPSSVRLVSGTVGYIGGYMWCGISATNGFGARTTSYYYITSKGEILEEENPDSFYLATDELNIQKINKKLEKTLGSY